MTPTGPPETSDPPGNGSNEAAVVLVVPADAAYLALLRTVTAGLAARLDLDLDEIEGLRIAVDEAGTLLLLGAGQGDRLRAEFRLGDDEIQVEVSGPCSSVLLVHERRSVTPWPGAHRNRSGRPEPPGA